jgi:hypothetical protein
VARQAETGTLWVRRAKRDGLPRTLQRGIATDRPTVPGAPWIPPALAGASPISLAMAGGALEADRVAWSPSFRIIASEYAGENLFDRLADEDDLEDLRGIADLTNPHALAEMGAIELVRPEDRIYGPGTGLIMATFAWPGRPSRFSDGERGTYYAALAEATAVAETVYHDEAFLAGAGPVVLEKTLIEAELDGTLVDLRRGRPAPPNVYHPADYTSGEAFGRIVRRLEGDGIVYDSVRHRDAGGQPAGECAAVFRPPVLRNAVAARLLEYHWDGRRIARVR